ncbi:hypothetical protein E2562_014279 [Oryza meyeriana var. granulata]|uniref:Uncharacterized protein n=1 Tax=Oryza meyeriana var. granulata TaxID=110450 RepID=A0A6G1C654_9ORYZ|nr:hypothetical protein E2562_014279 [Oryza meyeriana var. granulata]
MDSTVAAFQRRWTSRPLEWEDSLAARWIRRRKGAGVRWPSIHLLGSQPSPVANSPKRGGVDLSKVEMKTGRRGYRV